MISTKKLSQKKWDLEGEQWSSRRGGKDTVPGNSDTTWDAGTRKNLENFLKEVQCGWITETYSTKDNADKEIHGLKLLITQNWQDLEMRWNVGERFLAWATACHWWRVHIREAGWGERMKTVTFPFNSRVWNTHGTSSEGSEISKKINHLIW